MRKIAGALILVVAAALYRAEDISRLRVPVDFAVPRSAPDTIAGTAPTPAPKKRGTKTDSIPLDYKRNPFVFFSSAPKDSLVLLPGVGPVLAERIINARTGKRSFTRWDDLLAIKGIGPKTVERLKRLAGEADTE